MRRLAAAFVLASCSHDLTCELLAKPSNCFAQTAAALAACMPMSATPATLSADKLTCTFADGVYVAFNYPVTTLDMHAGETGIHMTVYGADGSECGHLYYEDNVGSSLSVTVGSQSAAWEVSADGNDQLVCPSHTYTADSVPCTEPGFAFPRGGAPPYTFAIFSAATPSPLFTCQ